MEVILYRSQLFQTTNYIHKVSVNTGTNRYFKLNFSRLYYKKKIYDINLKFKCVLFYNQKLIYTPYTFILVVKIKLT